jgi:hypothetical protein
VTRFERVRKVTTATVVTLVVAALSFIATQAVIGTKAQALTSGDFTIQGTMTASYPSCAGSPGALLYPGSTRCITYTVADNLQVPITVQSITTSLDPNKTQPSNCSVSNLNLAEATFSGSLVVNPGTPKSTSEPIGMYDGSGGAGSHTNQDGCQGATFKFLYSGTGTYTEVYGTSTVVASSQNPSAINQAVTYTATVTGIVGSGQDPLPNSPTGRVTFKDNGSAIPGCSNIAVASSTASTSTFTCVVTYGSTAGSPHPITAAFTDGADANFTNSTSAALGQAVSKAATSTVLTSTPNPSNFGQSVTMTATVSPSTSPTAAGTVSFYLGTILSHILLGTGTLNLGQATFSTSSLSGGLDNLYAVYSGDPNYLMSNSSVITQTVNFTVGCINNTVNGGYTVATGKSICITGRVNGGVTVKSGGSLFLNGATINGGVISTGATALRFCGSTINGGVTANGTTGFVMIGDDGDDGTPACAGNTINGGATLITNKGGFEIGGNTINGTVTLTGNTGNGPTTEDASPEVEGNKITGSLSCAISNVPTITNGGYKNTVTGSKSSECSGAEF